MRRLLVALAVMMTMATQASAAPRARRAVRVLVPDEDNLQYLAFWVADGAGYFREEGIDLTLSIPSSPGQALEYVERNDSEVFVLPPPMYLELIGQRAPIVLVANLLQNDPINLVVRRSVLAERKVTRDLPVGERLKRLAGIRVGVAPHPPPRLRALYAAQGMDADRDIEMVILRGPEQNYAFEAEEVDALYAHTPFLETALVDQGAVLVVDQSAGEVPALSMRQIHALVVTRALVEREPQTVFGMTRAIARAERLVHSDHAATVASVMAVFPSLDRVKVDTIVRIYEPAVPATPQVSTDGIRPALALFPANKTPPNLDGIDLGLYVAPEYAEAARERSWKGAAAAIVVALVLLVCGGAWAMRPRLT